MWFWFGQSLMQWLKSRLAKNVLIWVGKLIELLKLVKCHHKNALLKVLFVINSWRRLEMMVTFDEAKEILCKIKNNESWFVLPDDCWKCFFCNLGSWGEKKRKKEKDTIKLSLSTKMHVYRFTRVFHP